MHVPTTGQSLGVSTMAFGLFNLKHTQLNLIYLNKFKKDINCNSNSNLLVSLVQKQAFF